MKLPQAPPWHARHRVVVLVDTQEPREHLKNWLLNVGVIKDGRYRGTVDAGDFLALCEPPSADPEGLSVASSCCPC